VAALGVMGSRSLEVRPVGLISAVIVVRTPLRQGRLCAGLRVSELTGLRLYDVATQAATIRVRGKGRCERASVVESAAIALRVWIAIRGQAPTSEVFVKCTRSALQPQGRRARPHVLHNAASQGTAT
jgi:site-specific recombinase XerC